MTPHDERLYGRIQSLKRLIIILWAVLVVLVIVIIAGVLLILGNQAAIMVMQTEITDKPDGMTLEAPTGGPVLVDPPEAVSLGEFTITYYSASKEECGKTDAITATGTKATAGRTIAVDPDVIPLGSRVVIDGVTYTAEDVGGAIKGNKIDIFVNSREEAIQRGKIQREVKLAR